MIKTLPNKWVRKAVFDAINNIEVDGKEIPCFDMRVPTTNKSNFYTLLTSQTNQEDKNNKCESLWESSILIDIVTIYNGVGNTGSRLAVDNITDAVRSSVQDLTLDSESGLQIMFQTVGGIDNLDTVTKSQNVYRILYRIELTIN
jgi:hypothetical protein|tara:strand:- start:413 stop:847 length:435 start_codon:yes stop_codon:yes gene_type:complete